MVKVSLKLSAYNIILRVAIGLAYVHPNSEFKLVVQFVRPGIRTERSVRSRRHLLVQSMESEPGCTVVFEADPFTSQGMENKLV